MDKLLATFVCLAAILACDARAQIELKFGHSAEPGSIMALSAEEFARRVNSDLGGKASVRVFASSQLGGDRELLQKLKLGTVELALPGTVMSSESDLFGLFELPYLIKDRTHMRAIEQHIVWPYLAPDAEKKGLKLIAVWENGYRHITNNRRPINVPQDLEGMKLRVPEGKWRARMFAAYGAKPSPLQFSELFSALQTGVMDGQENPFTNIYTAKLHQVQKYLSVSGHVYTPAYVTVGARNWATLPSDIRKALEATARDLQPFIYASAERADAEMLEKLRATGMRVNEVDKSAFVRASRAVYQEFAKEVPRAEELIEKALALAGR
jgi:tripartite ATP-independent transporter DctP family solute receptor